MISPCDPATVARAPAVVVTVIVVAAAGDSDALDATLTQLSQNTSCAAQLVLCSDEAALIDCAKRHGVAFQSVLPPQLNAARYWCTLREVMSARRDDVLDDTLIVRAGTQLPKYFLSRWPLPADDAAATVLFPLAVRHPAASIFADTGHQPSLAVDEVDRWLNKYAPGRDFDVPVFAGYTARVRFGALPAGNFDNDWDLARTLQEQGQERGGVLRVTDSVYVDDSVFAAIQLPAQLYPAWFEAVASRHPLTALRHALAQLSQRREMPPPTLSPVQPATLHVCHSWGGGLGRWVDNFTAADTDHTSLILRPIGDRDGFGKTLALYTAQQRTVPLRSWTLCVPILSSVVSHGEYRELLRDILQRFPVTSVLVSSLIGHSLEVLDTGLPTVFVCHDYYPFCPPILATWGSPCESCTTSRLRDCVAQNPAHRFFRVEPASHWQALRAAFLHRVADGAICMVAPSRSVIARYHQLMPQLQDKHIHWVEHGLGVEMARQLRTHATASKAAEGRLQLIVLGSLEPHKGVDILEAALPALTSIADVTLLGCGEGGEHLRDRPGVGVIPYFTPDELAPQLQRLQPDLGLLLSTVPETFSYTLSELFAAAIPVAATRLGAFADRISHGENGWLFDPDSASLVRLVRELAQQPSERAAVRERLLRTNPRDVTAMVADYYALLPAIDASIVLFRPRIQLAATAVQRESVLHINPEARFSAVLRAFATYVVDKAVVSRRLPAFVRRALSRALRSRR